MKKLILGVMLGILVIASFGFVMANNGNGNGGTCVLANGDTSATGFDEYGYNRCAHQFVGTCESWALAKGISVEKDCGIYANDKLVMKWNDEWDRGNAEGWSDQNGYGAWEMNEWNGAIPGGSGEVYHFKTRWNQECAEGTYSGEGDCIWGQFEVQSEHYSNSDGHFWLTHTTPTGYGSN